MADDAHRYLGFAFASADLLFELDGRGVVTFALGAAKQVAGVELDTLSGVALRDMVSEEDQPTVDAFLGSLEPGERRGPIRVALKPKAGRKLKRYGALCACRLPQMDPTISCSLTLRLMGSIAAEAKGPNGLHSAESFAEVTEHAIKQAARTGVELNMELVELSGLRDAAGALGKGEAAEAMQKVAAALRAESYDGASAAELHPERYALLRPKAEPMHRLTERLSKLVADMGLEAVKPTLDSVELDPSRTPDEGLRTLKVALDRFITDGATGVTFDGVVQETVAEVESLRSSVASRDFALVYQPVVNLTTSEVDHYETFVRLGQEKSPAHQIQMAEEMDMIQDLDMAVVQAVVQQLLKASNSKLRLAANISARSLKRPAFAEKLLTVMRYAQPVRGRLILEITGGSAIGDLQQADALVRGLRRGGAGICLDGFGGGAASLDYLRQVAVDAIKIDGRYIRELASAGGRNGVLVRHLGSLCRELKITSIAQMVETKETVAALHQVGIDCGQGFLFGRPEPTPTPPVRSWQMMKTAG